MTVTEYLYRSRRLIFRNPEDAAATASRYADNNSWRKERETPDDPETGNLREVVWQISATASMHYLVDDATGLPYIYFSTYSEDLHAGVAAARDLAQELVGDATQRLDVYEREELISAYNNAEKSKQRASTLLAMALGSPQESDEVGQEIIMSALKDRDKIVRSAAVYATTYTPSAHYIPILRSIKNTDKNRKIRDRAADVIAAYKEVLGSSFE